MNNKPLIISTLLVTSAAAFGLGWKLKPSGTAPSTSAPGGGGNVTLTSTTELDVANAAVVNAESQKSGKRMEGAFAAYMRNGSIDPDKMADAIKSVMNENDPLKKRELFSQLLSELTAENAVAAYDAVREASRGGWGRGGGRGDNGDMQLLLNAWGRVDGKGAVEELAAREKKRQEEAAANGGNNRGRGGPGGDGGGMFDMYSVVSGWATADSTAASSYVSSIEDERQRGMLSNGVVQGLLVKGVDDALGFVSSLPADDRGRSRLMSTIAEEVLEQGSAAAANWVSTIGDDDLKGGAMDRIAGTYAREDLESAVTWVGQHAGEDYANRAVSQVAERWAEADPQAVIDWAGNLPENAQAEAFEEALDEWTEKDPMAASEHALRRCQILPQRIQR
ncbi:MAG: hypothetical protein R3F19_20965 [Verrucomicrobiales bacterium]